MRARTAAAATLVSLLAAGCGGGSSDTSQTRTVEKTRVEVISPARGTRGFDPSVIYRTEAPGVVTVISVLPRGVSIVDGLGGGGRSLGSGFVLSANGEIATNAHVVTSGSGRSLQRARAVYVQFGDGNQVSARIVGTDANADVALLRVDPSGLDLRPLPLGSSAKLVVGSPVAAIGSPFGEPQSLSVGVISATDRTIDSLTNFSIAGAIQTDAAINHGNSGGPLVDAHGRVVGVNSQIRSTGGGGEGVGFAVPIDTVKHSLDELRRAGRVRYAFLGVSTIPLFPQLARRVGLPVDEGAYIQALTSGGPAARAGLRAGKRRIRFQASEYVVGGDLITKLGGRRIHRDSDLGDAVERHRPGDRVTLEVYRGGRKLRIRVKLGERPNDVRRSRP